MLLWAHPDKAGFSGKENDAGNGGRKWEKRETNYEMDLLLKGNHRLEYAGAEQGC